MIPEANSDHVLLRTAFVSINDLLHAVQDARILPRQVPQDRDWGEYRHSIPRLGLEFRVRYQLKFGDIQLDAYQSPGAPDGNELRLGIPLLQGSLKVGVFDLNGTPITSLDYTISGRAFVYGSVTNDPETQSAYFVIWRLPEFHLDDQTDRIPPFLQKPHMEGLLAQAVNREIRARPRITDTIGQIRFPIAFPINAGLIKAEPITHGVRLADTVNRTDQLSVPVCLVGLGNPSCNPNSVPVTRSFFQQLDTFMRVATNADPVTPYGMGRRVQLDVGWRVIDNEISRKNGDKPWEEVAVHMFRYRVGQTINWNKRGDQGSIRAEFRAEVQLAYPKIKWCERSWKTPFGRVTFKYPCGVERAWHPLKAVRVWVEFRLSMKGEVACIELIEHDFDQHDDIVGLLMLTSYFLVGGAVASALVGIVSPILSGAVTAIALAAATLTLALFLLIDALVAVAGTILQFLPDKICANIRQFLTIPIIKDRVDISLRHSLLQFHSNGIILATDPVFRGHEVTHE